MTTLYDFFVKEQEAKRIEALFAKKFLESDFDKFAEYLGYHASMAPKPVDSADRRITITYSESSKVIFDIQWIIDIRGNSVLDYTYYNGMLGLAGMSYRMSTQGLLEDFDSWLTEMKCFVVRIGFPSVNLRARRYLMIFLFHELGLAPEFLDIRD